ncbi:hypothetical protein QZH41_010092 [Actinostola sp. cb2023]|nr:hypothetical protein QZH41_010092 [Actinostola sp. cb2023]
MYKKLSKIYYSAVGYWKGYDAINKLADAANIADKNSVKNWSSKTFLLFERNYKSFLKTHSYRQIVFYN